MSIEYCFFPNSCASTSTSTKTNFSTPTQCKNNSNFICFSVGLDGEWLEFQEIFFAFHWIWSLYRCILGRIYNNIRIKYQFIVEWDLHSDSFYLFRGERERRKNYEISISFIETLVADKHFLLRSSNSLMHQELKMLSLLCNQWIFFRRNFLPFMSILIRTGIMTELSTNGIQAKYLCLCL